MLLNDADEILAEDLIMKRMYLFLIVALLGLM